MPKNSVGDWDVDPSNNTDIGGINIDEGCAPSGINNAIRTLMAQAKVGFLSLTAAATRFVRFDSAQDLSAEQRAQARSNVGAASTEIVTPVAHGLMSKGDKSKLDGLNIWTGTQAAYDALPEKVATTLYFIT